jgi:hypothetical protein
MEKEEEEESDAWAPTMKGYARFTDEWATQRGNDSVYFFYSETCFTYSLVLKPTSPKQNRSNYTQQIDLIPVFN